MELITENKKIFNALTLCNNKLMKFRLLKILFFLHNICLIRRNRSGEVWRAGGVLIEDGGNVTV